MEMAELRLLRFWLEFPCRAKSEREKWYVEPGVRVPKAGNLIQKSPVGVSPAHPRPQTQEHTTGEVNAKKERQSGHDDNVRPVHDIAFLHLADEARFI